jgi:O-antigen/teichoic acid export membrane protein
MKRLRATLIKNAAFNILRGCAAALAVLALPHFLTRSMDTPRFAAWSLMLQVAAYANFLDFGLQTAIARFTAQAIELEQHDRRDHVVETSFVLLAFAGALAFAVIGVVIVCAGLLFHGVPPALLGEFQLAALILALGAALTLPLSAFSGVLFGMHRNEFPALTLGGSRVLGVVLAILAAQHTQSLIVLALCIAGAALAGGLTQIPLAAHFMPSLRRMKLHVHRALATELMRYCGGLTAWSLAMLLISGLDLTIVGHFQFSAVGFYAVGAYVITLMVGFNSSVLNAFLTPQAALHARGELERLARLLRRTTRGNSLFNFSLFLLAVLAGHPLLRLWVGESYAAKALPVLIILAAAQVIRLAVVPYCMMMIATGEQGQAIFSAAVEAAVNLTASLWLAHSMGYIGVAWGTLIGAVAGMAALVLYTMPRAQQIPFSRWQMLESGLLRPMLALLPLGVFTLACAEGRVGLGSIWLAASLLGSALLAYALA